MRIVRTREFSTVTLYMIALILAGLLFGFERGLIADFTEIMRVPGVLITDYFVVGSIGAALVNAGIVGLAGLGLVVLSGVPVRGYIVAAIFTMAGFSFMGKTIINIWPIFLGVWIYARTQGDDFSQYILNALFGTALAPLVSSVAIQLDLGLAGALVLGTAAGFLVPPLAGHFLASHQGLNLYNIGFTCGFIGTLFAALFRGIGQPMELASVWGTGLNGRLALPMIIYSASMVLAGLLLTRGNLSGFLRIWRMPGALVSDFVSEGGLGGTLLNMGIVGLLGTGYVLLVRGDLNGPTLCGIFTMIGFGAFGKHPRNSLPIMAGAYLSLFLFQWQPAEAGPLLGVLFGTTLAPIAGTFGTLWGLGAGFLHMAMVMNVGSLHGGMNLYNNGFAGGIVATLMVGVLKQFNHEVRLD
ncbi:MAG: DUF1576 domain-containing protein [Clostridia bacterium]